MQIGQLSRQITTLPRSGGGFRSNIMANPKNETCKAVETDFEVITKQGEDEIVEEDVIEKEESGNQGEKEEIRVTIEQLIDKNSHLRRTKK